MVTGTSSHACSERARRSPEHKVLVVDGRGARVDGVLAERAELRLEDEQVGLDRGGYLVSTRSKKSVVITVGSTHAVSRGWLVLMSKSELLRSMWVRGSRGRWAGIG